MLSSTTSISSCIRAAMLSVARAMWETSGVLVLLRGVGTHIIAASESATTS